MFGILVYAALICSTMAGITDLNCTVTVAGATKYGPRAVNCPNKYPNADCEALFGAAVKVDTDTDRDAKCYKNAGGVADEARKELVIIPRITCSAITNDMCTSLKWKDIITQDCPNVCGFCEEGGRSPLYVPVFLLDENPEILVPGNCVDIAPGCGKDPSICRNVDMQQFVKENCKKTCGFCTESGGTTSSDCGSNANCVHWVRNGFCRSSFYTDAQKKKYCGKACKLC
ncbi:shTK domain protein [Ancylostoma ceylanicum]|uniref:ShTK domain protein n=1 Tax=Ancylostoma ceylanicum TaxID=53326 RepID=A0A0D6LVL7_9BILA|nr:shTK domain protein [Ancylostoma ceylanicum]